MRRTMLSTVYSRSSGARLLQRLGLFDGNICKKKVERGCVMLVRRECAKRVDVGIGGARDTRWMNAVLGTPFLSMVTV